VVGADQDDHLTDVIGHVDREVLSAGGGNGHSFLGDELGLGLGLGLGFRV
jgi:hypothetical protein